MRTFIRILLAGIGILVSRGITAQVSEAWVLGPRIGMNLSSFADEKEIRKTGPAAGVFVNYTEGSTSIAAELLYSFKGEVNDLNSEVPGSRQSTELRYIEMPIQAMYHYSLSEKFHPKIGAGLYTQFLVQSRTSVMTGVDTVMFDPIIEESRTGYKPFDLGLIATTGFNFRFWEDTWINADIRYGYGLIDIQKGPGRVMNSNWAMMVGVAFPLKK